MRSGRFGERCFSRFMGGAGVGGGGGGRGGGGGSGGGGGFGDVPNRRQKRLPTFLSHPGGSESNVFDGICFTLSNLCRVSGVDEPRWGCGRWALAFGVAGRSPLACGGRIPYKPNRRPTFFQKIPHPNFRRPAPPRTARLFHFRDLLCRWTTSVHVCPTRRSVAIGLPAASRFARERACVHRRKHRPRQQSLERALWRRESATDFRPLSLALMVARAPIPARRKSIRKIEARTKEGSAGAGKERPGGQIKFRVSRRNGFGGLLSQTIQNRIVRESFLLDPSRHQTAKNGAEADADDAAQAPVRCSSSPRFPNFASSTTSVVSPISYGKNYCEEKFLLNRQSREREFIDACFRPPFLHPRQKSTRPVAFFACRRSRSTTKFIKDEFYQKIPAPRW